MNRLLGKASKKILIFGSSSFVGTNLVKSLSATNNHIICIDRKIKKRSFNKNIFNYQCDVNNYNKLSKIKNKIQKKFKHIDVIINCFVEQNYLTFENQSYKKFNSSIKTNVGAIFSITKLFYKLLKKSKNFQNL